MTRSVLVAFGMLALVGCGGSSATATESNSTAAASGGETTTEAAPAFAMVSIEQVEAGIADNSVSIFAAASADVYNEHHVPGAVRVDREYTRETLPTDTSRALVFYCGGPTCMASHGAAERAVSFGFTNVSVMGAGISGWVEAGKPVETGAGATN